MILKSLIQLLKEYPDYKFNSEGFLLLSPTLFINPFHFQYLGKVIVKWMPIPEALNDQRLIDQSVSAGEATVEKIDILEGRVDCRLDLLEERVEALEKIIVLKNEIAETFKEQCESGVLAYLQKGISSDS